MLRKLMPALKIRALILLPVLLLATNLASADDLPELGALLLSPEAEEELGQNLLRNWRRSLPLLEDPPLDHYVQSLVSGLASYSGVEGYGLRVLVINDEAVNAFAAPGGILGLNVGLLKFVDSEVQLAGVIAHELAHLQLRHFVRQLSANQQARQLNTASMIATIGLLLTGNPALAIGTAVGSSALSMESRLSYSREYEREADIASLDTLEAAGYDPQSIAAFLRKLDRASSQNQDLAFLYTHPLSSERASYLNARLSATPALPADASARPDFNLKLMLARIDWLNNQQLRTDTDADLATYRVSLDRSDCPAALTASASLAQRYPDNLYLGAQDVANQIDCAAGDYLASSAQLIQLFGASKLSLSLRARAWQSAGEWQRALEVHQSLTRSYPEEPQLWRAYAQAATRSGDDTLALRAQAEMLQLSGQIPQALRLLRRALELNSDTSIETAKLEARLAELEQLGAEPGEAQRRRP